MNEHGRAFQCEPCRQIIIFFAVSDASSYIAAGACPPIAPGKMTSHHPSPVVPRRDGFQEKANEQTS
jgi:hypothetical protein